MQDVHIQPNISSEKEFIQNLSSLSILSTFKIGNYSRSQKDTNKNNNS